MPGAGWPSPKSGAVFPGRWLAIVSWLLKQGREKDLCADLPGKRDYQWRALRAVKLTGWIYMALAENE